MLHFLKEKIQFNIPPLTYSLPLQFGSHVRSVRYLPLKIDFDWTRRRCHRRPRRRRRRQRFTRLVTFQRSFFLFGIILKLLSVAPSCLVLTESSQNHPGSMAAATTRRPGGLPIQAVPATAARLPSRAHSDLLISSKLFWPCQTRDQNRQVWFLK